MKLPPFYLKAIKAGAISKEEAKALWKDLLENQEESEVPPSLLCAHQRLVLWSMPKNKMARA